MSDELPPPRAREQPWERTPQGQDPVWGQIDRMWSDLKRDNAEKAAAAQAALAKFEATAWKAIERLDESKADKWVQTALTGAVTAVVMAVLMALLALVVVGKPGKGSANDMSAATGGP